ncbi:trypsin-like peptidase domain-containing protein [Sphingomonas sp. PAMC 26605]|uniref:trypsin-like peptidase domain-containing protein n=1 Tax=Sphingomonas sp. PAMC 26605 TaxID=1112214 RepID=UPI00026CA742|nr:trypsin-like peptidase domain-containing protein [Sphingomonas sp. PAMC 26605]
MKSWNILRLGIAAMGAALLAMAPAAGQPGDDTHLDGAIDSTVRIRGDATGQSSTGWVIQAIDKDNRAGAAVVVTSLAVIDGAKQIFVRDPKTGTDYPATVLNSDADRNLTFLEVKNLPLAPIPIAHAAPQIGQVVFALGYNRQADDSEEKMAANASAVRGSLSRELQGPISTEARAPVNQLEHDAPMLPGFEGGPLLDTCGRLVGMNVKSGGKVVPRWLLRIETEARVMNALKFDEVVKAANQYGVKFAAATGCEGAPDAAASDTAPGAHATAPAPTPTPGAIIPGSGGLGALLHSTMFLVALALLGTVAVVFGIYTMTRRDEPVADVVADVAPGSQRAASRPATEAVAPVATAVAGDTGTRKLEGQTLRLNGRGPAGEPIELSFWAADLAAKPVMLGVGSNADVRIPDNRADHRVSRLHARLGYDGQHFTIEDNKSLNGTTIGSRKLAVQVPTTLMKGDTVGLADIVLQVSID